MEATAAPAPAAHAGHLASPTGAHCSGALPVAAVPSAGQAAGQPGSSGALLSGTPGQQVVLLPPALMAQQMAAAAGGMGLALQHTPQGLQMVQRPLDGQTGQQGASPPATAP